MQGTFTHDGAVYVGDFDTGYITGKVIHYSLVDSLNLIAALDEYCL